MPTVGKLPYTTNLREHKTMLVNSKIMFYKPNVTVDGWEIKGISKNSMFPN